VVLPAILPARAIDTSLRLLTDILSTILAPNLLFHDIIARSPAVEFGDEKQRYSNKQEPEAFVDEGAVGPYNRTIVEGLTNCVVAFGFVPVVVRSML
jgi:hypothetical protein